MPALVRLAAAASLLGFPALAPAHSLLLEATPAVGATVPPPDRLTLRFNNRVEKALSRLQLVDAHGAAQRLVVLTAADAADTLSAVLPRLAPGPYRVEWRVLSADGHVVSGRFEFRVAP